MLALQRTVLLLVALVWAAQPTAAAWFEDVSAAVGVDFTYDNGMQGEFYFAEIMGGGAALFDFNGNGKLDLYLVQGGAIGPGIGPEDRELGDRLFRNDSYRDDNGQWVVRFSDVTEASGIDARGYGMGVAVGDYSGNGYPDIYVLNFGANQLWHNNGDGTFTDVTERAGVNDSRWSVSASFADLTGNGLLDLVVVNYVDYSFENHKRCRSTTTGETAYCSPSAYEGVPDSLFINNGDGSFRDASQQSGLADAPGPGLGVVVLDLTGNDKPDIFVANDGGPNFLWVNEGDARFSENGFLAGVAVNASGGMEAGMGVDAADFNRTGLEDLFLTHMRTETNTLYVNLGDGWFEDRTNRAGLGTPSFPYTGFGTAWLDIDNNGWLDLIAVNGAVIPEPAQELAGAPFPYDQRNQIFINRGQAGPAAGFDEKTDQGGPAFDVMNVSRGAAFGDINNNGLVDVVIANINGPVQVLLNQSKARHNWLGLKLLAERDGRDQSGARAWLMQNGQKGLLRRSRSDGSYASANDPRVIFGLADSDDEQAVVVQWPDGQSEFFPNLAVNRYHTLIKGTGDAYPDKEGEAENDQ